MLSGCVFRKVDEEVDPATLVALGLSHHLKEEVLAGWAVEAHAPKARSDAVESSRKRNGFAFFNGHCRDFSGDCFPLQKRRVGDSGALKEHVLRVEVFPRLRYVIEAHLWFHRKGLPWVSGK